MILTIIWRFLASISFCQQGSRRIHEYDSNGHRPQRTLFTSNAISFEHNCQFTQLASILKSNAGKELWPLASLAKGSLRSQHALKQAACLRRRCAPLLAYESAC